jgi:hypothetical protein
MPGMISFVTDAETVPPRTTIGGGPSGATSAATPSFAFTSNEAGSTFECRIDGGSFAACTAPYTSATLAEGSHTFEVRATDLAGNVEPVPESRTFTVDTTPPGASITSGPSGPTDDATPAFAFTAGQSGSTFECRVDGGAWASCGSPFTSPTLVDGAHTFEVRATDPAGNVDATPASRSFTVVRPASPPAVDNAPARPAPTAQPSPARGPTVSITSVPKDDDPVPVVAFVADQPDAGFRCRIDGGATVPCASPYALPGNLPEGDHVLEIVGVSAGGVDGTPVRVGFTVGAGCAGTNGFRSAGVRGSARGLAIQFVRRFDAPVRADLFQVATGRKVLRERLIARYRGLTRSLTWSGRRDARGRRIVDGMYFVRLSIPLGPGRGSDTRRLVAQRSGGRWTRRPDYYGRPICGLVTSYKLERPVFGGANRRPESVTFRLARPAKVTVVVVRGSRVVKRLGGRTYPARRTVRLKVPNAGLRRGVYSFRLRAQGAGRSATATAGARML